MLKKQTIEKKETSNYREAIDSIKDYINVCQFNLSTLHAKGHFSNALYTNNDYYLRKYYLEIEDLFEYYLIYSEKHDLYTTLNEFKKYFKLTVIYRKAYGKDRKYPKALGVYTEKDCEIVDKYIKDNIIRVFNNV